MRSPEAPAPAPAPSPESSDDIGPAALAMAGEAPGQNPDTEQEADVNNAAERIEAVIGDVPATTGTPNRKLEQPDDILELTPEEGEAKLQLEWLLQRENRAKFNEAITPLINRAHSRADKVRNGRDKVAKKAQLLEYREGAKQRKSNRLEASALRARPGSRRQRRLSRKLGKTNRKLRATQTHIARLNVAPEMRATHRENAERLRRREIDRRRDILKAEKKVAVEKKNRRSVMKEMKETTNKAQKEWLKQEIAGWQSIGKFREGLLKEAMNKYKERERQSDYDLAA